MIDIKADVWTVRCDEKAVTWKNDCWSDLILVYGMRVNELSWPVVT